MASWLEPTGEVIAAIGTECFAERLSDALRTVVDPTNGKNLVRLGWIRELSASSAEIIGVRLG